MRSQLKWIALNISDLGGLFIYLFIFDRNAYHFFSGIGLGTAFTRQGKLGWPDRFLPRIVPTRFSGRMTKKQMQQTATCSKKTTTVELVIHIIFNFLDILCQTYHGAKWDGSWGMVIDSNEVDKEGCPTDHGWDQKGPSEHLLNPSSTYVFQKKHS